MKSLLLVNTGCNIHLRRIKSILKHYKVDIVKEYEKADIIVFYFCAITKEAINNAKKQFDILHSVTPKEDVKVIAGGCLGEHKYYNLKEQFNEITEVFGRQNFEEIISKYIERQSTNQIKSDPSQTFHYINIEMGCNRHCTFCKMNYIKDRAPRAMLDFDSVTKKAIQADKAYAANIFLSGENTTEYTSKGKNLTDLLNEILKKTNRITISLGGVCMDEVTPDLIEVLKNPRVYELQLEAQSLIPAVRKTMGLSSTREDILKIFKELSNKSITSSIIMTGFPGETNENFKDELETIKKHNLWMLRPAIYCNTENTPSYKLPQISNKIRDKRYYELEDVIGELRRIKGNSLIGTTIPAILRSTGYNDFYRLSSINMPINFYLEKKDTPELQLGETYQILPTSIMSIYDKKHSNYKSMSMSARLIS